MKNFITIIILFGIAILLVLLIPNKDYVKQGKLYINEILPSNETIIKDQDGEYSDYIELYNDYDFDINLENYHLSDSEYQTSKWSFPNITIKSKEYLLIYASGKNNYNSETKELHTNFKLNSEGEVITLTDNNGNIISKIKYEKKDKDIAYGYLNEKYIYMNNPTPGKENDKEEYSKKEIQSQNYTIYINEYMTHNKRTNYISDGGYYDWVELYNYGDNDIEINNLYISDSKLNLKKYKIDNAVIKSKSYLVIYFTDKKIDNYICITNFKLSDNDEELIISSNDKIIDRVAIVQLKDDVSYGRKDKDWKYFTKPTPSKENTTMSFDDLGGTNGNT